MKPSEIKAVSFDAAGTLIHLAESVGNTYARIARHHGIHADPAALDSAFGIVWRRTPDPFSAESMISDPHEKSWWRRLVLEVFLETSASLPGDSDFDLFFDALYLHFEEPGTWHAAPGAKEIVSSVSSAFRCVVLSNFDERLRRILADLDLLSSFEALILSGERMLSKPDPRLFMQVSETLGIAPCHILHVGDDPRCDWEGAEAAGFQHFRVGKGQRDLSDLLGELSLA